ncbi:MAG TPA: tetratricopeptide repeat protein, partial [Anaerolineales bacterium]|nr:tetratricopeptide repeat protein [Anaerolineales bacterium]
FFVLLVNFVDHLIGEMMDTILAFDTLWNYNDPAGTEQKFRALLPRAEAADDRSYHAQLLTQLARTLGLQRRFDEAHQVLDTVETMLTDDLETARVRYLLERGRAFNSSKHPDQARPLFLEAWERAKAAKEDFYAVDAAHMLGIVEKDQASLDWNLQAIAYAEGSTSPRARNWLGSLYNNTGWTYHDMGEYEKALDLFERAVILRQQQGNAETIRIARWCVARCLRSLGRNEEALEIQLTLLKEGEETGTPDAYTHEELGELYLLTGDAEKARPHFAAAFADLSQDPWLAENEPERIARLKELGQR